MVDFTKLRTEKKTATQTLSRSSGGCQSNPLPATATGCSLLAEG